MIWGWSKQDAGGRSPAEKALNDSLASLLPNHAINCQHRYIHFTTLHRSSPDKMENKFEEIIMWYVLQGGDGEGPVAGSSVEGRHSETPVLGLGLPIQRGQWFKYQYAASSADTTQGR